MTLLSANQQSTPGRPAPRRHRRADTLSVVNNPDPQPPRSVGERLAAAMGWATPPTLTDAEEAEFLRRNERAQHAAKEFYAARRAA